MSLKDDIRYGVDKLMSLGISEEAAIGAVGSLMGESGRNLRTTAHNPNDPNGGSYGIAQWHSDRWTGMLNYAEENQVDAYDRRAQFDYIAHELETTETRALNKMKAATSLEQGAKAWTNHFERPNAKYAHHANRQKNAYYAQSILTGKVTPKEVADESLTGAKFRDPAVVKVGPTEEQAPQDPFSAIFSGVENAASGIESAFTGAQNQAGDFFGKTTTGAQIGAVAGGLLGGMPGMLAGALLGQGLSLGVSGPEPTEEQATATEETGLSLSTGTEERQANTEQSRSQTTSRSTGQLSEAGSMIQSLSQGLGGIFGAIDRATSPAVGGFLNGLSGMFSGGGESSTSSSTSSTSSSTSSSNSNEGDGGRGSEGWGG